MTDLTSPDLRARAVAAALGDAPFDLLLTGGQIVNVATSEIYLADLGLVGGLIASVHPQGARIDALEIKDCTGLTLAPGLIDTHMHIESSMVTPRRYAQTVVPQGTTTVVWDPHEVGNVAGLAGVKWAIEAGRDLDLRVLTLAPSCVPSAPGIERAGAEFLPEQMEEMLRWDEIYGIAEVMDMRGVLTRAPKMTGIVNAGLAAGKPVCGHARSLLNAELQAFAAAGVSSDHEMSGAEDFMQKLRTGLTIELRGSHDYVLPPIVEALQTLPHLPQTVTLCTDDVFADDLVAVGGMNDLLRRLVGHGMAPLDALRAATLNAAQRLKREDLGLLGAGKCADIVAFKDLQSFDAAFVIASGKIVAEDGKLTREEPAAEALAFTDTMKLAPLSPADFEIRAAGPSVRVNTVDQPRFTRWGEAELPVIEGIVQLRPDMLRLAVTHRHGLAPAIPVVGILEGWGTWNGAIATTIAHDSHNLNTFGSNAEDMAVAANALIACGGGMAVAQGGKILALLPLPVCGLLSDAPTQEVGRALAELREAAANVADWLPPLRTFKALVGASLACNAGPHVTDMGICDGATGEIRQTVA